MPKAAASKNSVPEMVCGELRVRDPGMENVPLNGMRANIDVRNHVVIANVNFTNKM